jgi:hypothetical protein
MVVELDDNQLIGVIGCIQSRLLSLEQVYCRNVNEAIAPHFSALIVRYVRLMRKFEPRFELVTGSTSLQDILAREVYDA